MALFSTKRDRIDDDDDDDDDDDERKKIDSSLVKCQNVFFIPDCVMLGSVQTKVSILKNVTARMKITNSQAARTSQKSE